MARWAGARASGAPRRWRTSCGRCWRAACRT
jgi:hypothetical protein